MSRNDILGIDIIGGDTPMYNFMSTIVSCPDTDYIFLYGGFDELDNLDSNVYLLNVKTMTWEVDDKHRGLYREGHSAVYIGNGNILVFGGIPHDISGEINMSYSDIRNGSYNPLTNIGSNTRYNYGNESRTPNINDSIMLIYNIYSRKWVGPPEFALINAPSLRSRHACCLSLDESKVYISGGLVNSEPLNDLYSYDLLSGQWSGPIEFVSRFHHSIAEYEGKLYAFGGMDKDMNHVDNNLTWLDLKDRSMGEIIIKRQPTSELHSKKYQHFFLNIDPSMKLDVSLPHSASNSKDFAISALNLAENKYTPLIQSNSVLSLCRELHLYSWRLATVLKDKLYVMGSNITQSETHLDEETNINANEGLIGPDKLCFSICINLPDLGVPMQSEKHGTLSDDFKLFLLNQEYTDFKIVALADESLKSEFNKDPDFFHKQLEIGMKDKQLGPSFKTLDVHSTILLARWDHFRRLINSGMKEAVENTIFIPEAYTWVKGMIFYLYTDSVEFDDYLPNFSIVEYSGMLVLANLYSLPVMRSMILCKLYKMTNALASTPVKNVSDTIFEVIIKVWENVVLSDEPLFLLRITPFLRDRWSSFIRSNVFKKLPKDFIILLCQQCSESPEEGHDSDNYNSPRCSTPEPIILRAMNVSPQTSVRNFRSSHSNSPFVRNSTPPQLNWRSPPKE